MALVSVLKELQRGPASRSSPADESYNRNGIGMERSGIGMERSGVGTERSGVGMERIVCGGADALRAAASAGDFERVKELCKKSVAIDADSEGRTALHYSSLNGHLQIVKEIINAAAKVNVKDVSGFTPLHLAASEGHVEIVKLLLKSGALVDAQDELQGNTALHEAAWKGFSQTIEVLMKHKANAYIKNKGGFSPLHLACQQGHNGSARALLLARCKPDLKNNYGDTPLHTAARYGHAGVARILISAFCDVSPVNKNGDTPLHITAAMGRRKLTKILLESGCDATLTNMQGETAMDIALKKSFKEVQEIIANPPPARSSRSASRNETSASHHKVTTTGKKREKESSLEGSKDSGRRSHKDRLKKQSKLGSSKSVQFIGRERTESVKEGKSVQSNNRKSCHDSPYGCPQSPDLNEFPQLKIDSLPSDPLNRGEQYFVDLAGNIKKGPVNKSSPCYCKPLFDKVEKKMESDKKELIHHIDGHHSHLSAKIYHLEKKTASLNETFKEKIACERQQVNGGNESPNAVKVRTTSSLINGSVASQQASPVDREGERKDFHSRLLASQQAIPVDREGEQEDFHSRLLPEVQNGWCATLV